MSQVQVQGNFIGSSAEGWFNLSHVSRVWVGQPIDALDEEEAFHIKIKLPDGTKYALGDGYGTRAEAQAELDRLMRGKSRSEKAEAVNIPEATLELPTG